MSYARELELDAVSAAAPPGEITALLVAARGGDRAAADRLFALVYEDLRGHARRQLRGGDRRQTLSTTALVNEAYVRLARSAAATADDRAHFFAVAATAMRQIVVDHARRRQARKRGLGVRPEVLDEARVGSDARIEEVLAIDQALRRLETLDARLARLVELRFFAGLSAEESAAALGVTDRTLRRDWRKACAFLVRQLASAPTE